MVNIRDFQLNQTQVSALASDTNGGQFLWIAYKQSGTNCLIQKVSANDVSQVYFSVLVPVSDITAMVVNGSYLYVAVTHATNAMYVYSVSSPLSSWSSFSKTDLSISEGLISGFQNSSSAYFITSGLSGNFAQLVTMNSSGGFTSTIDLTHSGILVENAISFTMDASSNFWVISSGDPTILYRVFYQSGGWVIQQTSLE